VLRSVWLRFRSGAKLCLLSAVVGVVGLLLLSLGWVAQLAAQGMMLPGKVDVTPTGAASYTIPIAVPPGTGGMVPSLSIAYNSQARNGLLGVGWHLEGLPSIGRCPRTITQDGVRGSVNYDANDRFCLDGQRLVAISGAYGADGTEYRTEIESFSKVISHGTAGTGPAWFEVWTKSGQRMEFGNTTDSRVLAQGKTTARDWVVSKVSDTAGNYFTITYVNDTTNGQVYPSRIDYTGNVGAGLTPYNSVQFVYDTTRPDVVPVYHLGSLQKTTVRLSKVQTYAGTTLVADYQLAYELSPITGRSRLTSVTLCTGGGACLPATTFAWQSGTLTPTVIANAGGQDGTLVDYRPHIGDFDGNGLPDVFWEHTGSDGAPTGTARVLWMNAGNVSFNVITNVAGQNGKLPRFNPILGDFNRDGKTDIWWARTENYIAQWTNTGAGTFTISTGPFRPSPSEKWSFALVGDGNGDGRSDAGWLFHSSTWALDNWSTNVDGITVVGRSHSPCSKYPGWDGCAMIPGAADFDGDGLSDIFWLATDNDGFRNWALWRGVGDGTFSHVIQDSLSAPNDYAPYFIDINGDGNADIVWDLVDDKGKSKGQRRLWLGRGDGTFIEQTNLAGQDGTLSGYRAQIGDFNGDGLPDILWVQEPSGGGFGDGEGSAINLGGTGLPGLAAASRVLWLGKGDGTFTVIANFGGLDGTLTDYTPFLADFNGDGKTDILWDNRAGKTNRSAGQRVLWLSDGITPDLITSVTTGIGAKVTVAYKSMTDGSVYTKDSTAPSGLVDVIDQQGPLALVSKIDVSNTLGGVVSTGYAYAGAKSDLNGRGFLGFRQMTVKDLQTNLVQTTDYRQDFPYLGLVASETKKLGAVTLNATAHAYGATPLGGTRFQAFLVQSQAQSADLNGSVLPTVTSAYKYDIHGNATEIVVSSTDGHAKTTVNTYTNDTTKWLLGRLTRATVTSLITTPAPPPAPPPTEVHVSLLYSASNVNLWNYLVANGWAKAGTPGKWTVTIPSNVVIGSLSASTPAFDTGAFPTGSVIKIINNGTIVGVGGNGGQGGFASKDPEMGSCYTPWQVATAGAPGGPALRALVPVSIDNKGKIWGGGGGGGGGASQYLGAGGGGGAGKIAGGGGQGIVYGGEAGNLPGYPGGAGTLSSGGNGAQPTSCDDAGCVVVGPSGAGGGPGQAGFPGGVACGSTPSGGAAGPAVIGNTFITWVATGDRKGPIN
jgi:hypothetical protein